MGMFDTVRIEVKCPNCGEVTKRDCQTKELECELSFFSKGDFIGTDQLNYLWTLTDCDCKGSGFDRLFFNVKVFLKDGIITGEYEVGSLPEPTTK